MYSSLVSRPSFQFLSKSFLGLSQQRGCDSASGFLSTLPHLPRTGMICSCALCTVSASNSQLASAPFPQIFFLRDLSKSASNTAKSSFLSAYGLCFAAFSPSYPKSQELHTFLPRWHLQPALPCWLGFNAKTGSSLQFFASSKKNVTNSSQLSPSNELPCCTPGWLHS